jgi:uncharacterized protein YjbI with pentapeptide repeats
LSERQEDEEPAPDGDRASLRADCESCFGLCCVVPAFSASADFAITKKAGQACPNLTPDFRCGIHTRLRDEGFRGCTVYDCFGAGQKVSQGTFGGADWRQTPLTAKQMFKVFPIMRDLHELLWYLSEAEALTLQQTGPLHAELGVALAETERITYLSPAGLTQLDLDSHRQVVNALLLATSELLRAEFRGERKELRGADLIGANLAGADLGGSSLRGAYLIGADLSHADLRRADLTGADLRGANIKGADLTGSLFLVQSQVDGAKGDGETMLPGSLTHPRHW